MCNYTKLVLINVYKFIFMIFINTYYKIILLNTIAVAIGFTGLIKKKKKFGVWNKFVFIKEMVFNTKKLAE